MSHCWAERKYGSSYWFSVDISPGFKALSVLWVRSHTVLGALFQNMTANHRVNDIIATEDGPQVLVGRFMYGPLDMVTLAGEKVGWIDGPPPMVLHSGTPIAASSTS